MSWLVTVSIALGGALITAAGSYWIARRHRSGTVLTSEAADLWRESSQLRKELYEQVTTLRAQVVALQEQNYDLQESISIIRFRHEECERKLNEFKDSLASLERRKETRSE